MAGSLPGRAPQTAGVGELLRDWRRLRDLSQLDLALETNISQRQISFIERGRSVPGRGTLLAIAQALEVPLRERNALLRAAGTRPCTRRRRGMQVRCGA